MLLRPPFTSASKPDTVPVLGTMKRPLEDTAKSADETRATELLPASDENGASAAWSRRRRPPVVGAPVVGAAGKRMRMVPLASI